MAAQPELLDIFSTEHLNADIKGRSVRGGLLTLTSQVVAFVLQSVSTVVLARLLTPADFGLVAMVTAITGLGQAFADLGLSEATIQCETISQTQASNLFWVNSGVGLLLTVTTAALAPVFAWFYKTPQLTNIALIVSLSFLVGGLRVQHDALLRRQMRFAALTVRDIASWLIAVPAAIILAWRGAGYWALVALPLILNITQMVMSWTMVGWRPSLPRRDRTVGSLIKFGGNVAASYVVITVSRSIDNVLVGWYWGAGPLGLYSRAYNLLMLPVRQLSAPATSVAVPAFSRIQDDAERFARYFLRAINLLVWLSAPIFGFLFVTATPVIVLLLGTQWRSAAPVFQILAISALGQLLLEATLWLFISRGQSRQLLRILLIISPWILVSFAIGLPFGIRGVALCGSLALIIALPFLLKRAFRGTTLSLARVGRALVCPVAITVTGALLAEIASLLIHTQSNTTQLLSAAFWFALALLTSTFIPQVRGELTSLRNLSKELRTGSQPVHAS